jgi:MFS family permease
VSSPVTRRPYHALTHREYRRLLLALLVSMTGSQMQNAAIDWHVYLLTRSPLALGAVGLVRVLPIVTFSLWGGIAADRSDRRIMMIKAETVMIASAGILAALTFLGAESLPLIYILTAVSAGATAFDNPSRQALVPRLLPKEDLSGGLTLMLSAFQAANICGPALGGLLIAGGAGLFGVARVGAPAATRSLALIYGLNALSFLAVVGVVVGLKTSGAPAEGTPAEKPIQSLRSGLKFVFSTPILVSTMTLDFFATFFSGSMSLLPIFADQILKTSAAGYGALRAAPGLGALVGSLYSSVVPLPKRQGRALLWAVAAYGAATIVFGLSRNVGLTFAALAATGAADVLSTAVRLTVRQLVTPDALRGRMTGVNMIFFMGGPQLGELEAGLLAWLVKPVTLGATVSVVAGGVATLVLAAAYAAAVPIVRNYRT